MMPALRTTFYTVLALAIALAAACNDPVRDRQIKELGAEVGAPGPEHRAGQPCLLCHSDGGPASSKAFAVAGTIYETTALESNGAEGVTIDLLDSNGSAPTRKPITNSVGNFYVPKEEWSDLAYAFRVQIIPKGGGKPIEMTTTVNREGSCNACHKRFPEGEDEVQKDNARSSVGQIFVGVAP